MDLSEKCLKIYKQTQGLRTTGHYFFFRKLISVLDAFEKVGKQWRLI